MFIFNIIYLREGIAQSTDWSEDLPSSREYIFIFQNLNRDIQGAYFHTRSHHENASRILSGNLGAHCQ